MARIQILTQQEIKEFEQVPLFKYKEKTHIFSLPKILNDATQSFQNDSYFLIFTLLFGYFKITNKFYDDTFYYESDIEFVTDKYNLQNINHIKLPRKTIYRYKQLIREYFKINDYTEDIKSILQKEANNLANNFIHRKKIFYTLVNLSKKLGVFLKVWNYLGI